MSNNTTVSISNHNWRLDIAKTSADLQFSVESHPAETRLEETPFEAVDICRHFLKWKQGLRSAGDFVKYSCRTNPKYWSNSSQSTVLVGFKYRY